MGEAGAPRRVDVAVVGGGPAGIAAAVAAAGGGARALLLDESPRPGGQIWRHLDGDAPPAARAWLERLARSGAEFLGGAAVVDGERIPGDRDPVYRLIAQVDGRRRVVEATALVLATGARELFLPFPGWTLPNVLGVGGAQALHKSGASFTGKRVVIAGSGPLLLPVSAVLARAGARIRIVAEQAPLTAVARFAAGLWREPRKLAQAGGYRAAARAAPYRPGSWVVRARGEGRVQEVDLSVGGRERTISCDVLCTGFGLVPNVALPRLFGCAVTGGAVEVDALQRTSVEGIWCAGEGTGIAGVEASLAEGSIAGFVAAGRPGLAAAQLRARDRGRHFAARLRRTFAPREELRGLVTESTLVCRCEDVPLSELRSEWTARQAKLYTRIGMGPCQGRVCGPAAGYLFDWDFADGRTPVSVASLETLAGASDGRSLR